MVMASAVRFVGRGANRMKRSRLPTLIVIIVLSITSCIVDSSWLGLVGRWQDVEAPSMELDFTRGGRFSEYFFGELVGYGEFQAEGKTVTLHYLSPCGGGNQVSCDVRLRFTVTEETLIITDTQGDLVFRRIGNSK